MNVNSDHPILGALFEKWRKEKDLNINTLAKEAHICTITYGKIKKGLDVRLSAYQSLFYYYSMDLEDDEIRQMVNEWLEGWLKVRKRE